MDEMRRQLIGESDLASVRQLVVALSEAAAALHALEGLLE